MTSIFSKKTGAPLPFGSVYESGGFNFSVYAKPADKVFLQIWDERTVVQEIELVKTGDTWHIWVQSDKTLIYTYSVLYENKMFSGLLDPYAKQLSVPTEWGNFNAYEPKSIASPTIDTRESARLVSNDAFPRIKTPNIPKEKLIIYEMHVRGFTQDPSSGVKYPGTYLGVIEKIPHLVKLGINAVKLLPVFEFNECEVKTHNPLNGSQLYNYWGYSTVHYFCPMRRYAVKDPIKEFREMVDAFHRSGIEVILDVVYNHTAEGNEHGPVYHFKGLANSSYYLLDEKKQFFNFSGCGNSMNANHTVSHKLILDSLRYWAMEMGVDGFRFDLAALLTRDPKGFPLAYPPLIHAIAQDPLLSGVKLFAEAWDAAGLYQLGDFAGWNPSWTEWNGKYRDHVREFIKGNPGLKGDFATRLCGSSDLYGREAPTNSLNFITAHDGFTLHDLVSYNQKHNIANGENDRDGSSFNDSWNCGVEGATENEEVLQLRERQMKNFMVALLTSNGIPMITSGDEYGQTKLGNNNTWCQDNDLNWIDWEAMRASRQPEFFHKMIELRKRHFQRKTFYEPDEIIWHGKSLHEPDWKKGDSFLAFELPEEGIYCFFNASGSPVQFEMPSGRWTPLVYTGTDADNSYSCGIYLKDI